MKVIIGGSTGFVGTELTRQALAHPAITSVVALSRRETPVPAESADQAAKLKSVVCHNFEAYSDDVKKELEDADACIWTIAVTPSKVKSVSWEETVKICRDYTLTAMETLAGLPRHGPLRFVYVSGHLAPRNKSEIIPNLGQAVLDMALMRGQLELQVLTYAEQSNGAIESCIAKPGRITSPDRVARAIPGVPIIDLQDAAGAMLDQVVNGFEKDTLANDDMIRIGQKALAK